MQTEPLNLKQANLKNYQTWDNYNTLNLKFPLISTGTKHCMVCVCVTEINRNWINMNQFSMFHTFLTLILHGIIKSGPQKTGQNQQKMPMRGRSPNQNLRHSYNPRQWPKDYVTGQY